MKKITLTVELTFSGELTKRQADDVVENVLNSLIHTTNTAGLVPDDAEEHTETITVTNPESGAFLGRNLNTGELI